MKRKTHQSSGFLFPCGSVSGNISFPGRLALHRPPFSHIYTHTLSLSAGKSSPTASRDVISRADAFSTSACTNLRAFPRFPPSFHLAKNIYSDYSSTGITPFMLYRRHIPVCCHPCRTALIIAHEDLSSFRANPPSPGSRRKKAMVRYGTGDTHARSRSRFRFRVLLYPFLVSKRERRKKKKKGRAAKNRGPYVKAARTIRATNTQTETPWKSRGCIFSEGKMYCSRY